MIAAGPKKNSTSPSLPTSRNLGRTELVACILARGLEDNVHILSWNVGEGALCLAAPLASASRGNAMVAPLLGAKPCSHVLW